MRDSVSASGRVWVRFVLLSQMLAALFWRVRRVLRWISADFGARAIQLCTRVAILRRMPRAILIPAERALIRFRGEGLFDAEFYLSHNPDVAAAGARAFDHYLSHGWHEGRAPNPRFDDGYYRSSAGLAVATPVSALAHFLAFGRQQGLCPVPGVDLDAYSARNPALQVAKIDPYRHLVSAASDTAEDRPDLDTVRLWLEGLSPPAGPPQVAIVVPVYLGRAETLNTICHVLAARCRTRYALVVVNDASPDAALADDLRQLAADGLITLLDHPQNQGFVGSVNAGTALHPDLDAVWLNADTEVYDGWLDRLRKAAYRHTDIATVTPLTNNGTICSYPRFNADNPGTLEVAWSRIDRLAARFNAGQMVEAPTGVGFAMYVRRDALSLIGPLDQAAFGRGYGEENDFCQRAIAAGRRNVIAADVVVRHFGETSFRGSRADRVEAAMKVLDRRYPDYRADVRSFLAADPLAPHRRRLDLARLSAQSCTRNVLVISHARGGGTHQHIEEEAGRLRAAGASVFTLTAHPSRPGECLLGHAGVGLLPGLSPTALDDPWLWRALATLRITEVQIHHLFGFGQWAPGILRAQLDRARIPYSFTVHDYFAVCPRINMVDRSGSYCGEPAPAACQGCIDRRGSEVGRPRIADWRAGYRALLAGARDVRAPNEDVAKRLGRYFPDLKPIQIIAHDGAGTELPADPGPRRPGPLRIAVLGAIGPIKGYDCVHAFARHLGTNDLPAEVTLIGYSRDDETLRSAGVRVTGPYLNDEAASKIDAADPDLIWIPSLWPETYCYTLSLALRSGRPIAAFDLGAQAARLRAARRGSLIPLALATEPRALWQALSRAARADIARSALAS